MNKTVESRFKQFRKLILDATGDRAIFYPDGSVTLPANGLSSAMDFRSLQSAIDWYARLLPSNFVNPH